MTEQTVRAELGKHQFKVASSDKRLILAGCGIGAGKTHVGGGKVMKWAADSPRNVSHIIAANSYGQLFDSTLARLYDCLDEWGALYRPKDLPENPSGYGPWNLRIWNGESWVLFRCRSLAKWNLISGQEAGCAWIDEGWDSEREAYQTVGDRVRDKRMPYNQRLVTSTLSEVDHWMHEVFEEKHGRVLKSEDFGTWRYSESEQQLVVYASTAANKHLPDEYIGDRLTDYSEHEANRMIGTGKGHRKPPTWGSKTGTIYHAFDRGIHIDEAAEYDDSYPVIWSHDFNIGTDSKGNSKPMSSVLLQVKRGHGPDGTTRDELHAFDEIVIDSADTNDAIEEWFARFDHIPQSVVTICGDASGRSGDTRSKTSDYGLLADSGFTAQDVPRSNPPIRTRHNTVNGVLQNALGDVRARIHPRCETLAKGLATVRLKPGASGVELETREQHVTTAFGYAACAKMAQGRKPTLSKRRLVGAK